MLVIGFGANLVGVWSDYQQINLIQGTVYEVDARLNDARPRTVSRMIAGVFVITSLLYLRWLRCLARNCVGLGAKGMRYSVGQSIGYYFVPFAHFFIPYRAMLEILKVSNDPTDWKSYKEHSLVDGWWTLWIISQIAFAVAAKVSKSANSIPALRTATWYDFGGGLVFALAHILLIALVAQLSNKQEALVY